MRTAIFSILFVFILFQSCEFNQSVKKDLITGLNTAGVGLSCDNVYLSIDNKKIQRNTFTYGETFFLNFNNISGFTKENGNVFPGMDLLIINETNDTILYETDMYADYTEGINLSPLLLQSNVVVADPILSNENYTFYVSIWDKKGTGVYKANMKFNVKSNKEIKLESKNIDYKEVYLFSENNRKTITDNKINLNDNVYIIFEGIEGMSEENGNVSVGLSIYAKDSNDNILINEADLIGDSPMTAAELKNQLAPNIIFTGSEIMSPVHCEVIIWDKKGENKIKANIDFTVK